CVFRLRPPPRPTLFPYTTLFRSGQLMLVPQAVNAAFAAATNAVRGATLPLWNQVSPIGSFTDPEFAQVGLTEAKAREQHDVVVRSEEHTSELQSQSNLVCRLLLE